MEIRRATQKDIPALAHLRPSVHNLHVAAHPDNFKPVTLAAATRDVASLLARDNVHIFLASVDTEPVGYLVALLLQRPGSALGHAKRLLYIDQMAVKDQYRGCGYGTKLLEAAQQLARELDLAVIELEVWTFNENAKQFFMAHGFTTLRERMSLGLYGGGARVTPMATCRERWAPWGQEVAPASVSNPTPN